MTGVRPTFLATLLAVVVSGCAAGGYDQRGGPAIANHIRVLESPLVLTVQYAQGDVIDSAVIDITLRPGVADADGKAFLCSVALPWAESSDPPEGLGIDLWSSSPTRLVAADLDCK